MLSNGVRENTGQEVKSPHKVKNAPCEQRGFLTNYPKSSLEQGSFRTKAVKWTA